MMIPNRPNSKLQHDKLPLAGRGYNRTYPANSLQPQLVLDAGENYFRKDGSRDSFSNTFTHSRASGATYLDSTGTLQTAASGEIRDQAYTYVDGVLTGPYLQLESAAATNLLHNTDALVTQTETVTAQPYTLHFTGTGTVTLSGASTAGPLVGTGVGENNRVSLTFTPTAGTLTLTVSGTVTNAQLEAGSIPTSYIPNLAASGSVTRAAETLTIPNPPWPATVEATGTELVTNGTFDTDVSGWIDNSQTGGAISWNASGYIDLTTDASGNDGIAEQTLTSLDVGQTYVIDAQKPTGGSQTLVTVSGSGLLKQFYVNDDPEPARTFVATATSHNLRLQNTAPNSTSSIDNISVKEITPRGLAIAMDGLMTYADTGGSAEATFIRWVSDTNNEIRVLLQTFDTDVGQIVFLQDQTAYTQIEVSSAADAYSPGINVPFSIASRHGDKFVNGAVDGTALTANLTPTILPDLSATPIQIGSTFNGYIKTLRVWTEAPVVRITDDLTEEASTP